MSSSDDPTAVQLHLIHELTTVLHEAGIPHWLFGGWVVDFLVGEITRPHSDIDLLIWRRDAPAFRDLLAGRGYSEGPSPSGPELDARFSRQSQLVEVMFLHERREGGVYWDQWCLAPTSLEVRDGRLGEILCPVVNPQLLLGCKEVLLRDGDEPNERGKHSQDVARLRSLI